MKTIFPLILALALPSLAQARKLSVLATFPDLADIAKDIGGDHVNVESIARGTEDPHQIVMKPSFVPKLNRADAVVYEGMELEHSFLMGLLDVAGNPKMRTDPVRECVGQGCIDCSVGIHVLERPTSLSRAEGEIHPQGNPHYNTGPQNGPQIARDIADGLSRIDPEHSADYEKNFKATVGQMNAKIKEWEAWVAPLKGTKAVSYHKDVAYIAAFTGLDFVDTIELKPGVPPTPTHLQALVGEMKRDNVKVILCEQQYSPDSCQWLAGQTGAKIAVVGVLGKAFPDTTTWEKFQEHNLKAILQAAGQDR